MTVDGKSNAVVVVLGSSKGFQPPINFPATGNPRAIAAGDFNSDGNLDIVVAGIPDVLLLATGTGAFGTPIPISSDYASQTAVGDFNGDGNPDIAFAGNDGLLVLLGHGDGTFGRPLLTQTTGVPSGLYTGRFHNNGFTDLLLNADDCYVLTSNGDGTFQQGPPVLRSRKLIAIADGDRNQDLVTVDYNESVQVWLSDGHGNFTIGGEGSAEWVITALTVADVNGDGMPDVITANQDSSVTIFLGNGNGTLRKGYSYEANDFPLWVGVGTYFGSDRGDLAILNNWGNDIAGAAVTLLRNTGGGNYVGLPNINYGINLFTLADMNHDGILDMVATNSDGTAVEILPGTGHGTFGAAIASVPVASYSRPVADFNHDGIPDFVVASTDPNTPPFMIQVGLGQPDNSYQLVTTTVPTVFSSLSTADFNGDGLPDLAVIDNGGVLYIALNTGQGTFGTPSEVTFGFYGMAIADFNNDGKLDIAVTDNINGTEILFGNGDGTFGPAMRVSPLSYSMVVADFNHAGNQDIALAKNCCSLVILLGNGKGEFRELAEQPLGGLPDQLIAADLEGDGHIDLIATSYGEIQFYLGEGNGKFFLEPLDYVVPTARPMNLILGDLNNDGKVDLISLGYGPAAVLLNTSK